MTGKRRSPKRWQTACSAGLHVSRMDFGCVPSRGDYASPDTNNGTLFLDFVDVVGRLSCGADCSIGGGPPPPATPEPASLLLLGTGLAALAGFKRKKQLNQV